MSVENYETHLGTIRALGKRYKPGGLSLENEVVGALLERMYRVVQEDLKSNKLTLDESEKLSGAIGEASDPQ